MAIELAAGIGAHTLPYDLEIRAFGDEEGVRFPVTLTGAHAAAGSFSPSWLSATDSGGTKLDEALRDFDLDPTQLLAGTCTARCFAYLEIHIEQGPVLESLGAPLGIVTAINGAERHEITLTGRAGHAGTVPMDQRQDALVAAAHMVLAIERIARAQTGVVATVGRLGVSPDAPNVIPGRCVFTIDLRASDDAARARAAADILAELDRLAATYHVSLRRHRTHAAPAVACDPRLQACLANALRVLNLPVIHLPSGAGHDAMVMADICPIGMMFVRCLGGISHHPDEAVIANDVALACQVMRHALRELDPHRL
jgi:allantoate deiminase